MKKLKLKRINETIDWRLYLAIIFMAIAICIFIVIPSVAKLMAHVPIGAPIAHDIVQYTISIMVSIGLTVLVALWILPYTAKRDLFSPMPKATFATRYYVANSYGIVSRIAEEGMSDVEAFICIEYTIDDIMKAMTSMTATRTRSYVFKQPEGTSIMPMISLHTASKLCKILQRSQYQQKAFLFYPKERQPDVSDQRLTHIVA